jgi:hypothetical protein
VRAAGEAARGDEADPGELGRHLPVAHLAGCEVLLDAALGLRLKFSYLWLVLLSTVGALAMFATA